MADHPKLAPRSTEDIENQMLVDKAECKISVNVVDFYHNNRMVVIETQEINETGKVIYSRFKLHLSLLELHAPVLANFLTQALESVEGTEENPVILPFTTREFTCFLDWIHDREWRPFKIMEESLVDLLRVSSTLKADDGISYAVSGLESLRLPSARMLQLVGDFHHLPEVHCWVGPAVKDLIQRPLGEITNSEAQQIAAAYPTIARTRENIQRLLTQVSQRSFALKLADKDQQEEADLCLTHKECQKAWKLVWRENIGYLLLDFQKPLTYRELLELLQNTDFPKVNPSCKARMLNWLSRKTDYPGMKELVEEAVASIEDIYHVPRRGPAPENPKV
ncbi:hypothetical protein C8R41DRAFT_817630 [Lentinula lateritia]|uniref:BTB domain-containing protein n=1 Tax=Lentinula lateritia TaxID=40482 RepID=A0ABQ8VQV4_9AGAR|nr:hypothetical protein C8R41DRAFT_817630 [Lentinula lateritia]